MPILVKDYTWEETENHVFITVPLKGAKSNKIDILTTEEYIKVRFTYYRSELPWQPVLGSMIKLVSCLSIPFRVAQVATHMSKYL